MLRFSDGKSFDLSGPLRKRLDSDGWYVIGEGMMIPVADEKEADRTIADMKPQKEKSLP